MKKIFAAILLLGRRAIIDWTHGKWDYFAFNTIMHGKCKMW